MGVPPRVTTAVRPHGARLGQRQFPYALLPAGLSGRSESELEVEAFRSVSSRMPGGRQAAAAAAADFLSNGPDRGAGPYPRPCSPAAMLSRHRPDRRPVPVPPAVKPMPKKAMRKPTTGPPDAGAPASPDGETGTCVE